MRNERNLGTTDNVWRCMTLGRLEYITVMGADDALEPCYVQVVVEAFKRHPDAIMVHPGVTVVDSDGKPADSLTDRVKRMASRNAWSHPELSGQAALESLMKGNWLYVPAMCFRRDVVPRAQQLDGSIHRRPRLGHRHAAGRRNAGARPHSGLPVPAARGEPFVHPRKERGALRRGGAYYLAAARQLEEKGWARAARAARMHPLSRLHAMQSAAGALSATDLRLAGALTRRALGSAG